MPTTTEQALSGRKFPMFGLLAIASIWFGGVALAALAVRPETVVGFGPPATMMAAVAGSDGYLLNAGRFYVVARTGPSTVRGLYAAGAWFVWPVIGNGCGR